MITNEINQTKRRGVDEGLKYIIQTLKKENQTNQIS